MQSHQDFISTHVYIGNIEVGNLEMISKLLQTMFVSILKVILEILLPKLELKRMEYSTKKTARPIK